MIRRAVFDFPAAPPGWDETDRPLVRIIDPLGAAIAWLAAGSSANCVGFAVRRSGGSATEWTHVFRARESGAAGGTMDDAGCSVLLYLPGNGSPEGATEWTSTTGDPAWTLVERDPTMAVLETTIPPGPMTDGEPSRSGRVRLRLRASLENAALSLRVCARNDGPETVALGLGLQLVFPGSLFGDLPPSVLGPALGCSHQPQEVKGTGSVLGVQPGSTLLIEDGDRGAGVEITPEPGARNLTLDTVRDRDRFSLTLRNASPGASPVRLTPGASTAIGAVIGVRFAAVEPADGQTT